MKGVEKYYGSGCHYEMIDENQLNFPCEGLDFDYYYNCFSLVFYGTPIKCKKDVFAFYFSKVVLTFVI